MDLTNKPMPLVAAEEQDQIDRLMLFWANLYEDKPSGVAKINYEFLPADAPGMALSTIQAAYILRRYILGGYEAEYQFKIVFRTKAAAGPAGNDARLTADETLNRFGDWAARNIPDIGDGLQVLKVEPTTRSSLFAAYDNGDEDHQILMKMTYERVN